MRRALAVALAACGAPAPAPTLAIGSAPESFAPIGETIAAYMGPQGGFHVYLTLRATGVDPGSRDVPPAPCTGAGPNPCVALSVVDLTAGRELDDFAPLRLPLAPAGDAYELLPPRLVALAIHSLDEVDGHRLQLRARVDDAAGAHVEASAEATCTATRP